MSNVIIIQKDPDIVHVVTNPKNVVIAPGLVTAERITEIMKASPERETPLENDEVSYINSNIMGGLVRTSWDKIRTYLRSCLDPFYGLAGNDKAVQYNDGGVVGGSNSFRYDKTPSTLILGIPDALPDNPLAIGREVDTYIQVNIQNRSEGFSASADYVVTADNGDDTMNYVDLGMASSRFDDVVFECTKANDGYLMNVSLGDLVVVSGGTPTTKIRFYAGGLLDGDRIFDVTPDGIDMVAGKTITNRPEIFYGLESEPSPVGLADGTLYIKYV